MIVVALLYGLFSPSGRILAISPTPLKTDRGAWRVLDHLRDPLPVVTLAVASPVAVLPTEPCRWCGGCGETWDGDPEHSPDPCRECEGNGRAAVPGLYEVAA